MKSQYVGELRIGQVVREKFLLTKKILKEKKDGGNFAQIELTDRTGTIEGIAWDNVSNELKNIATGNFVFLSGNVGEYNGRLQIVVNSISKISEDEVVPEDFLPIIEEDIDKALLEIKQGINRIQHHHLKKLLNQFFDDKEFMDKFSKAPAAKKNHHAGIGGLAVHTRNVMNLVIKSCETFNFLNTDLLIAGSLLHDIGKIYEYTYQIKLDQSTGGRLIGHIIFGYEMVKEKISRIPDFPEELSMKLLHLIISHHGEFEYGSPVLPSFPEALVLHFMDNLDAKLEIMRDLIRQSKGTENEWSEYHNLLGRAIYLGTDI